MTSENGSKWRLTAEIAHDVKVRLRYFDYDDNILFDTTSVILPLTSEYYFVLDWVRDVWLWARVSLGLSLGLGAGGSVRVTSRVMVRIWVRIRMKK